MSTAETKPITSFPPQSKSPYADSGEGGQRSDRSRTGAPVDGSMGSLGAGRVNFATPGCGSFRVAQGLA